MVKSSQLVLDEVAFTADINPTDLPTGPIADLLLGMTGATTAAAAITGVTLLKTISLLRIFSDGLKTELSGSELLALNTLYLGIVPKKTNSGAVAANPACMEGLNLPLNLPSGRKAQIQVVYVAQTNVGSGVIAVHATKLERLPGAFTGIQRRPITPTVTGAFGNKMSLSMAGAKLKALLVFSTTIPTTTAKLVSAHKIRLIVKGDFHSEYNWRGMGPNKEMVTGDTDIDAEIAKYRLIPLEEPIDASDVIADVYADDTNAVVLIPVYEFS